VDEAWRLLHLVAAAFWLGGLVLLAVVAIIASRTLERAAFKGLMSRTGKAFAVASVIAWGVIGVSGAAMAWPRLGYTLTNLRATDFGRLLETKTSLAILVIGLTVVHSVLGRRAESRSAVIASRVISPLLFAVTVGIFWMAVRMTEEG
jgi:putative copper export protein